MLVGGVLYDVRTFSLLFFTVLFFRTFSRTFFLVVVHNVGWGVLYDVRNFPLTYFPVFFPVFFFVFVSRIPPPPHISPCIFSSIFPVLFFSVLFSLFLLTFNLLLWHHVTSDVVLVNLLL